MDQIRDDVTLTAETIQLTEMPRGASFGTPEAPVLSNVSFRLHGGWLIVEGHDGDRTSIYPLTRIVEIHRVAEQEPTPR
jgi:hypothetical protein